ncbi:MAG TPA: DEAD/DEAH box helicase [Dehalococcoidia bacterium]|nr:DEAD/DEAH box helicase [Dehalococcoidia bacterium]
MTQIGPTLEIKRQLKRTWNTFFGRFGRLLPIQIAAIPVVLEQRSAILCSPVASGKTEAVVAPIAEILLQDRRTGLSVIYVSPTRALVNDLRERLAGPLSELGLPAAVKTADHPQFDPGNPQSFLLTTPEALDSLICRSPSVFTALRFVVLDEIHLIDGTYRGDQLRLLLRRLKDIARDGLCCYALSATLSRAEEVARRYFDDFVVISIPGRKELEYRLFPSLEEALKAARASQMRKILIFCNRRREAEQVAAVCKDFWPSHHVVVHHGRLARGVREQTERFMRECQWGLCVATMTLEIGIDIGDIDLVVLYGAPWSVASLLQRVGRGNRRKDTAVAFGVYRDHQEEAQLREMFELARVGAIDDSPYQPDLSVAVQQIFSSLYQHRTGLPTDFFCRLLEGFCLPEEVELILAHLAEGGYIEARQGRWFAAPMVLDMGDRGLIHSNIRTERDYKVVDASTGRVLGEVSMVLIEGVFRLAGRAWRVLRVDKRRIYVVPAEGGQPPEFLGGSSKGAFSHLLPPELR